MTTVMTKVYHGRMIARTISEESPDIDNIEFDAIGWPDPTHPVRGVLMVLGLIVGLAIVFVGLAIGFAAAANADIDETPPPPTTTDVSSGGMIGDANMGLSWGTPVGASNGYAVWAGPYRIESSGYPVSRFASDGPGYTSETTTNYNYEGGVEQWSRYDSDFYTNREYRAITPTEGFKSQQNVRYGSMSYKCVNGVCTMVPTA